MSEARWRNVSRACFLPVFDPYFRVQAPRAIAVIVRMMMMMMIIVLDSGVTHLLQLSLLQYVK